MAPFTDLEGQHNRLWHCWF